MLTDFSFRRLVFGVFLAGCESHLVLGDVEMLDYGSLREIWILTHGLLLITSVLLLVANVVVVGSSVGSPLLAHYFILFNNGFQLVQRAQVQQDGETLASRRFGRVQVCAAKILRERLISI
jgi:hypothetical protein